MTLGDAYQLLARPDLIYTFNRYLSAITPRAHGPDATDHTEATKKKDSLVSELDAWGE